MTETENEDILQLLTAFADGELDASRALQALTYLQGHAYALRWIHDQQRITIAARAGLNSTVHASDRLREKVLMLMKETPAADKGSTRFGRRRFIGSWIALAASVVLAASGVLELWPQRTATPPISSAIIPASIVAHASQLHADCSRLADGLHAASFVERDGPLASDVERDLRGTQPYPDLSSIGFRYEGAGPCAKPLDGTIHLLYRSMRPGVRQAVSLFAQHFTRQFSIERDRVYTVSVAQSPFPMLMWRTDRVVYFLLADSNETEQAALAIVEKPMIQSAR